MSRKGKWRFIHADGNGTILDSVTFRRPQVAQPGKTESSAIGGKTEDSTPAGRSEGSPPDADKEKSETSAFFGDSKQIQGAFIVGVASTSRRKSIRVWNGRIRYSEWEFIGVETTPTVMTPGQPVASPGSRMPGSQP
jgi:hypothetical protein